MKHALTCKPKQRSCCKEANRNECALPKSLEAVRWWIDHAIPVALGFPDQITRPKLTFLVPSSRGGCGGWESSVGSPIKSPDQSSLSPFPGAAGDGKVLWVPRPNRPTKAHLPGDVNPFPDARKSLALTLALLSDHDHEFTISRRWLTPLQLAIVSVGSVARPSDLISGLSLST